MRPLVTFITLISCSLLLSATEKRPNFVFIFADDISRDSFGIYGNPDCKTPHIDQLAKDGMVFNKAYCATAMCGPFRHELYTGRSPWRTGTMSNHTVANKGTLAIGDYLIDEGYLVSYTGKGHSTQDYPWSKIIRDRSPEARENPEGLQNYTMSAVNVFKTSIRENKPFCFFIASNDGHGPHNMGDPSIYDAEKLTLPPYYIDTPEMREALVQYYAEVTRFDQLVGEVRRKLKELGLADNTLLMVNSEQGNHFPFAKWTCYNNGRNTALLAQWPGVIKPGSINNELVSIADIVPTFVDAAGVSLEKGTVDGKSFLPMLKGEKQVLRDYLYGGFSNIGIAQAREQIFPIRVINNQEFSLFYNPNHVHFTANYTNKQAYDVLTGEIDMPNRKSYVLSWIEKHKEAPLSQPLIKKLNHRPEYEFYNLSNDPNEISNQIDNLEYADLIQEMKQKLHQHLKQNNDSDPIKTDHAIMAKKEAYREEKMASGYFEQRTARKAMMKKKKQEQ